MRYLQKEASDNDSNVVMSIKTGGKDGKKVCEKKWPEY